MLFFSSYLFLFFSSYLCLFFSYYILPLLTYSYLLILKLFIVLQTCVLNTNWAKVHKYTEKLMIYRGQRFLFLSLQNTYSSFWGVFWGGQAFFDPFGVKVNVFTGGSCYSPLHISSYSSLLNSSHSSRTIFFLFLHILIFIYLNCLLYYRHAY